MNRRNFLLATLASALASTSARATKRAPRLLLRSSWQTVNIGDIAHTPGVLALLEKHLPEVEVRLWPGDVKNGVKEMLQKRFPKLVFVETTSEVETAFAECDFLLHGSGPSLVAAKHLEQWLKDTGKPFGVYGITLSSVDDSTTRLLNQAAFVFFRDSVSLSLAREQGVNAPVMEFGPDGAFAVDLRDAPRADAFLKANKLEPGRFLCCIPRARRTPYWLIPSKKRPLDPEAQELNARMQEHDHAPHREAILRVVRETDLKILLCPEDQTQMRIGKEAIYDPLPDSVKERVVWRESYWLTDEALSTYIQSAGLFGNEMHSPIMCIGNGIPAIVCRWKEQTSKGFMWRDIGLEEWLFDFDQERDLGRLPDAVLELAKHPEKARAKVLEAQKRVHQRQSATMQRLGNLLSA
jgi:polysaccharide pyruvyl transferase WcaK-like protein